MKFKYKSQTKNNGIAEGIIESPDVFSVARDIREKGDVPISIKEFNEKKGIVSFSFDFFGSVSLAEKIIFTNNLSGMLQAGLAITRALGILEKQSTNNTFKKVLHSLVEDINQGVTLSDSMKKFPNIFSSVFVSMVRSGEESGSLAISLKEIGVNLKKSYDLNKKIKGAMMYPSIILGAIVLIGVLMMIYVVPTLTKTFKELGTKLPSSTQFIIWISDTLKNNSGLLLVLVVIIGLSVYFFSKLKIVRRAFSFIILRLPAVGQLIKEVNTARTARTLSSLLSSGVDMSKALSITEEVLQNVYYKELIRDSITSIEKGYTLSSTFKANTHLYPVMVGEMIEVGEETGKLSSMLLDIANFYEEEVDNKTKDLSTIIEPILMIFIGGAVGFFAVSMITPMYSIMDNVK